MSLRTVALATLPCAFQRRGRRAVRRLPRQPSAALEGVQLTKWRGQPRRLRAWRRPRSRSNHEGSSQRAVAGHAALHGPELQSHEAHERPLGSNKRYSNEEW